MMNFQHLAYWQEKAKSLAIETRLFINGEYCAAADNTTFETIDPAAQQTLAQVARGKKADVDRAVKAARGVFDNGDWSQASPAQRKAVLTRRPDGSPSRRAGAAGNAGYRQTDSPQPARRYSRRRPRHPLVCRSAG
jgi:delta 1-pyrroline-5-carboxylate dehydrogenase